MSLLKKMLCLYFILFGEEAWLLIFTILCICIRATTKVMGEGIIIFGLWYAFIVYCYYKDRKNHENKGEETKTAKEPTEVQNYEDPKTYPKEEPLIEIEDDGDKILVQNMEYNNENGDSVTELNVALNEAADLLKAHEEQNTELDEDT